MRVCPKLFAKKKAEPTPASVTGIGSGTVHVVPCAVRGNARMTTEGQFAPALDSVDAGLLHFDAEDRLVTCNATARSMFAPIGELLKPGVRFAKLAEAMAKEGVVDLDGSSAKAWVRERVARHGDPKGAFEQPLADGRWLWISERRSGDGGIVAVCTDITDAKKREQKLREEERLFENLTEIGTSLSAEKDIDRLLEKILLEAKSIANADGGTIYLYAQLDDSGERPADQRIDRRSGGDRRSAHDRRQADDRPGGEGAGKGPPDGTADRRQGLDPRSSFDRRQRTDVLKFAIMRNDTLNIALGGTTGKEIPFPPLRLYDPKTGQPNHENVATLVALKATTVNIADAYVNEEFDFSGTKAFDAKSGYRSTSFLTIPMKNKIDDVIGVLQLINARDKQTGEVTPFAVEQQRIIAALASQAAVALDNQMLLEGQRNLLDSFIRLIADAIDRKSPYTGGHCKRVPVLAEMIAEAACAATSGPFKDFTLNDEEIYELHIAAWLHDCGKVTTPEYVVDKATKLETKYDRIGTVITRFEVLKRDAEVAYLKSLNEDSADHGALEARFRGEIEQLDADRAFIGVANIGGEFMDDEKKERVKRIAKLRWRSPSGEEQDLLSEEEVYNLCISRGTLTDEEREIINNHIVATIEMLSKLPFPKGLKRVPEYAGGHHEKMDGTGYPRGLTRDQMSVPARMVAIADIFEALTAADRPYKKAKPLSEAMKIMSFMKKDNHIDPELFDLFIEAGLYRKYAEEYLSADQIDEVDADALLGRAPKPA